MDLKALLTLNNADKLFANPKRIALLKQIRITGSISQGAKQAGISYKAAWDAVNDMNLQAPQPVVSSEKGGKGGGGAKLTEFGERLLKLYELMDQMQDMVLKALLDAAVPMDNLLDLMAHFSLKTSARNQLAGEVIALKDDSLNDNVRVKLAGGQEIDAAITHASTDKLGLHIGKKVLLLFKLPPSASTRCNNPSAVATASKVSYCKSNAIPSAAKLPWISAATTASMPRYATTALRACHWLWAIICRPASSRGRP